MNSHPAKFNKKFIPVFAEMLNGYHRILDPFSGVGTINQLEPYGHEVIGVEIEKEWSDSILGNSRYLPFKDNSFDAICTSPTYGNRMADSFVDRKPEKKYKRNTYHAYLQRKPSIENTGRYKFGKEYCFLHRDIWRECARVLKSKGKLVLNTKNFIHGNVITDVTGFHVNVLKEFGFTVINMVNVPTSGLRYGSNPNRVGYEIITELLLTDLHK